MGITQGPSLLKLPVQVPWGWDGPQEPPESQAACWEGCPLTPKPARPVPQVLFLVAGNLALQAMPPRLPG